MTRPRLQIALASFAALAVGAAFLLTGEIRLVVWIFLAGLGVKSWIAYKKETLG
ncbi:MAG: hypothetical protein ABI972_12615 [Acidobacteriota bacterium]